jgi:hypothetical protein
MLLFTLVCTCDRHLYLSRLFHFHMLLSSLSLDLIWGYTWLLSSTKPTFMTQDNLLVGLGKVLRAHVSCWVEWPWHLSYLWICLQNARAFLVPPFDHSRTLWMEWPQSCHCQGYGYFEPFKTNLYPSFLLLCYLFFSSFYETLALTSQSPDPFQFTHRKYIIHIQLLLSRVQSRTIEPKLYGDHK